MKKKVIIGLVIVVGLIAVRIVTSKKGSESVKKDNSVVPTTVIVEKAKLTTFKRYLDLYGELKANNEVQLTSPVTGKVLRFNRFEGAGVRRGQPVVSIDRFEVGARYAAAPVISPVNGVVTRILVSEGSDVTIGTPVATVGDINLLEATIQVPEVYVPEVKVGQTVRFQTRASGNEVFEGKIHRKDLSLNPETRSLTVRALIPNTNKSLFSGIFADSYVFVEEVTNVYVVPESALTKDREGFDAIFVNQGDQAKLRQVEIALRYRDSVALKDNNIKEGEEIIIFGREYLSDGAPIKPLNNEITNEQADVQNTNQSSQL